MILRIASAPLVIVHALQIVTKRETDVATINRAKVPIYIPDDLLNSDAFLVCQFDDINYNPESCSQAIWDYERRIRFALENSTSSITEAKYYVPTYQSRIDELTELSSLINNELDPTVDGSIMSVITHGQNNVDGIDDLATNKVPILKQKTDQMIATLSALPTALLSLNHDLLFNVTKSASFLTTMKAGDMKSELASISTAFTKARALITAQHALFMSNMTVLVNSENKDIASWPQQQLPKISNVTDELGKVFKDLRRRLVVLEQQFSDLTDNMTADGIQQLAKSSMAQRFAMQDTLNSATSNLNSTYNTAVDNATAADASLSQVYVDYRANMSSQFASLQQHIADIFTNLSEIVAAQETHAQVFTSQQSHNQQQKLSLMNISLTDAADAILTYEKVANATEVKGLLETRRVLTALNDMLRDVKASVSRQTASFAGAAAEALQRQAQGVGDASAAGKAAALTATSKVSGKVAKAVSTAGSNTRDMVGSIAELLVGISRMSDLMKAKIGLYSSSSDNKLSSVSGTMSDAADSLADTISQIREAGKTQDLDAQNSLLGVQADSQQQAAGVLSDFQSKLGSQLDSVNAAYADVGSQASMALDDASRSSKDAAAAVSNVQDASSLLRGQAKASASEVAGNFAQLSNVVNNTATASDQAVEQARKSVKAYIQQVATQTAQAITNFGAKSNQTFRTGFFDIQKTSSETINRTNQAYADILTTLSKLVSDLQTGVVDYDQLIESTIAQNASVTKVIDAIANDVSARWDSIMSEKEDVYTVQLGAIDDATQEENNRKLSAMRNISYGLFAQVNKRVKAILSTMHETIRDSNITGLGLMQALTSLNNTAVSLQRTGLNVSTELDDLNTAQDARFHLLRNQSDAVDSYAIQKASDVKSKVIAQNATIISTLSNFTNNITAQVSHDATAFVDFTGSFMASINQARSAEHTFEQTQSDNRLAVIAGIQHDMRDMRSDLMTAILAGNSQNSAVAEQLSTVLGELANSQKLLADENSASMSGLQQRLTKLGSLVSGVSGGLAENLNAAKDRIAAEATISLAQEKTSQTSALTSQSSQVTGLGNSVLRMLDGVIQAGNSGDEDLNGQQAASLQMAQLIQGLGSNATVALRQLLSAVQSGELTVQQALKSATQTNSAALDTIGGVASDFQSVIGDYVAATNLFFENAAKEVLTYNESALANISDYKIVQDASADGISTLANLTSALSNDYIHNMRVAITNATAKLHGFQTTQSADAGFVK